MKRKTILSEDRRYRYTLWREWQHDEMFEGYNDGERGLKPYEYAMFIGLNPSTADETKDDPTIRRCIAFAKSWGYGALCMTNLFAFRATKPDEMKQAEVPDGDENLYWLTTCADHAGITIAAWGKHGAFLNQDVKVCDTLARFGVKFHCLRTNADGSPEHPLYIPADTQPIPYQPRLTFIQQP